MPLITFTTNFSLTFLRSFYAIFLLLTLAAFCIAPAHAQDTTAYISTHPGKGYLQLADEDKVLPIWVSEDDYPGVVRVAKDLQKDFERVTDKLPELMHSNETASANKEMIIIGTIGKSPVIDALIKNKKLNVAGVAGKWETFLLTTVDAPMPGVDRALVIAGSDKRGTIFGTYDLSYQIGVSPLYWWADVPPKKRDELFMIPGKHTLGSPAVKYRGIFINDEAPAFSGWAIEKFGGFNHKVYEHVFELILRMKGNYLWPAMWGRAFYDDDPKNAELADEYGVVIGTTHHEPMMRAHVEWSRYGEGAWNYEENQDELQEFWREGIQRMGNYESTVSLGMRGDGDEPMSEDSNIELLERIVADQREILKEETGQELEDIPQFWALYKEVLDYYEKGMDVPEDVMLLLCDDNWGNVRKLPEPGDAPRKGGYGMYYHYDYVGGPRNYKWLNTNPISRVWEQMHLTYRHGVDELWVVNVGDIKPMEFPIEFFLDYAWNPDAWPAERLPEYNVRWAEKQFGKQYAVEIAEFIEKYTRYNGRRKPELLDADTYSLVNYNEAERIVEAYNTLALEAERVYDALDEAYKDAYYQLVLFPILACANLNELYVTVGKNRLYATQGRTLTNAMAEKAKALFEKDAELTDYYNNKMADGKWSHMMDQTHIGYTYWQQPEENVMPEVNEVKLKEHASMAIAIESSHAWFTESDDTAILPEISPFQSHSPYFEVFNQGKGSFDYKIKTGKKWLSVSKTEGGVETQERLTVDVDWDKVPAGKHRVPITINGPNKQKITITASVNNPEMAANAFGFMESNGYIAMESGSFAKALNSGQTKWQLIPGLGRTQNGITPFPVTAPEEAPGDLSPHLEYDIHTFSSGEVKIKAYLSPTLNYYSGDGLRYAISIDDEAPQIINMHAEEAGNWNQWVSDNINEMVSTHQIGSPGNHKVKFWMVDPGVVLQRIVIETEALKPSYLGPPESIYQPKSHD